MGMSDRALSKLRPLFRAEVRNTRMQIDAYDRGPANFEAAKKLFSNGDVVQFLNVKSTSTHRGF